AQSTEVSRNSREFVSVRWRIDDTFFDVTFTNPAQYHEFHSYLQQHRLPIPRLIQTLPYAKQKETAAVDRKQSPRISGGEILLFHRNFKSAAKNSSAARKVPRQPPRR
ncbi:hypothetical protein TSAR_014310, partial [Trichomalopsis sarcophagae]